MSFSAARTGRLPEREQACLALRNQAAEWRRMLSESCASQTAAGIVEELLFLRFAHAEGVLPGKGLIALAAHDQDVEGNLRRLAEWSARLGLESVLQTIGAASLVAVGEIARRLLAHDESELQALGPEILGAVYEQFLAEDERASARRADGVYYTPPAIARLLVEETVAKVSTSEGRPLAVLDPACGSGVFLLAAFDELVDRRLRERRAERQKRERSDQGALSRAERQKIVEESIRGIDLDPRAVEVTKRSLLLKVWAGPRSSHRGGQLHLFATASEPSPITWKIFCNNSLTPAGAESASSWFESMGGPFDVVIGNPPWGQKAVVADDAVKARIRSEYPSAQGIFDWFRPFVELAIRLTRRGGFFGMVLPDILLLKDYELTRTFILEHLAMTRIDWLGMAFPSATIDAVTLVGCRDDHPQACSIDVHVHDPEKPLHHAISQADFWKNPRRSFNLHLTPERRRTLERLLDFPKLGDAYEVHEGIHSGNIRDELFVGSRLDDTCRELIFGRDELTAFSVRWRGKYVRLSAMPERKTRERYANLGRPEWHEAPKVIVRRTGDTVQAAVDEAGRFVSNNFFVLLPKGGAPLPLDAFCALLNSELITWFFRAIEPREGRAFAELKIKHIVDFPLPRDAGSIELLAELGAQARTLCDEMLSPSAELQERRTRVVARIDETVERALGVSMRELQLASARDMAPSSSRVRS